MNTYQTNELISELQRRVEVVLNKSVSQWQTEIAAKMEFTNHPSQWSAAQSLSHLNSYGAYYLPAIERSISGGNKRPNQNFKSSWLGNYFYQLMLPQTSSKKKFKKMKAPKNHIPQTHVDADVEVAEFIDQAEKLLLLLEQAKKINIAKAKVPISIAKFIKLQLGDVFLFLIAHIERHVAQAERMLANAPVQQQSVS